MGERVALNLVQRMCGVSTQTRTFVDAVPAGSKARITDTRKTTPGLRALERYAVRVGGGHNHRDDLGAAVLIKDNHVAACGGVRAAIERARAGAPHTAKIECEVDSLDQLDEALAAGADIVLLDNMPTAVVREAVASVARARAARGLRGHHARARRRARAGRGRRHLRRGLDPLGARGRRRPRLRDMKIPGVNADLTRAPELVLALGSGLGRPMVLLSETTSTNDVATRAAREGAPHGATWVAERQTQGRGRRGHAWLSPAGEGLLFSVLVRVRLRARANPADRAGRGPGRPRRRRGCVGRVGRDQVAERRAGRRAKGGRRARRGGHGRARASRRSSSASASTSTRARSRTTSPTPRRRSRWPRRPRPQAGSPDRAAILADVLAALDRDVHVVVGRGLGLLRGRLEQSRLPARPPRPERHRRRGLASGIDDDGRLLVRRDDGVLTRWSAGEVHLVR